ncbi:MAG TPA: beta-L-arabinofuranosidase domain-containing protein [Candidatus Acidoferrum sp.]
MAGLAAPRFCTAAADPAAHPRAELHEFNYDDVSFELGLHDQQLRENISVLMNLSDDSLLKPLRAMSGQPAPGEELGGWYLYDPNFDGTAPGWAGFAPACTFGQWVSALARAYAISRDEKIRAKVLRLNQLYARTISGDFYENNRFPAYCYDKLVCALMDSHRLAHDPDAYRILEHTTDTALPHLPGKAIEHGKNWRPGKDDSYSQDESYTVPENLFLAYHRGAGKRYRALGAQYLDDEYFNPLAEGQCNFAGRHAYSHVNALCSAMQAYMTLGGKKYLQAAMNGFDFLTAQSFATGGWGPDELLRAPDSDDVYKSLADTHSSFETPCGSYAHFKLTRYLLRITRDVRFGDSMERIMYNTVLGAKPLRADGSTFYYSDYNFKARKTYSDRHWACCSGTLPQVAADYRINTYFRDPQGVYVNLYIPSTLRWLQDGAHIALRQRTSYPFESHVEFELTVSRSKVFAVHLRIPAWAAGGAISVNGRRLQSDIQPGIFAEIFREWKTGDRIELELPLAKRLEPIDPRHPDTVALLSGPLVLFSITDSAPVITREQLLSATKTSERTWRASTSGAPLKMLPFTAIKGEQYSTYVRVG